MVFARKPAPVQATWLGYMCTTGLEAIDYRITDPYLDPPGATEHHYTNMLIRIPSAVTFSPAPDSPSVNDLPALSNGYTTFGSLNNYSKITDEVIAAWGGFCGKSRARGCYSSHRAEISPRTRADLGAL